MKLIGDVEGARVLEIGCWSGHSLLYLAQQGASEAWGLDLSHSQIQFASSLLEADGLLPRLFESPMEMNPGIPLAYFDLWQREPEDRISQVALAGYVDYARQARYRLLPSVW